MVCIKSCYPRKPCFNPKETTKTLANEQLVQSLSESRECYVRIVYVFCLVWKACSPPSWADMHGPSIAPGGGPSAPPPPDTHNSHPAFHISQTLSMRSNATFPTLLTPTPRLCGLAVCPAPCSTAYHPHPHHHLTAVPSTTPDGVRTQPGIFNQIFKKLHKKTTNNNTYFSREMLRIGKR